MPAVKRAAAMVLIVAMAVLAAMAQQRQRTEEKSTTRTRSTQQVRSEPQRSAARPSFNHQAPPGAGGGHIPRAPRRESRSTAREQRSTNRQRTETRAQPRAVAPHVLVKGDVWVGRAVPNDPRYRLARPWRYGRFPGALGSQQIWRLRGGGPRRFWFGSYAFMVAPVDYGWCNNWLWNDDDIVLYLDPDQVGWYIAYNVRLGTWVHVEYLGLL